MDTQKMKFIILVAAGGIVIILILGILGVLPIFKKSGGFSSEQVKLEIWGVFDNEEVFKPVIKAFIKEHKNFEIKYIKKPYQTYEKELIDALASGRGPDIFMVHNTWLLKHGDKLSPAPQGLFSIKDYRNEFVDVVSYDFIYNNYIYAVPLYVDTLALFWNKDIFNSFGLPEPPKTWEDLVSIVPQLIRKDEMGNIVRAAVALGAAKNISRSTDILALLMMQNGTKMVDLERKEAVFDKAVEIDGKYFYAGEDALRFYTDFSNSSKSIYTWNSNMHFSVDAFSENKVAMMFNYSYQINNLLEKAPNLNFGVAPMLQLKNSKKSINYANYWGFAVSSQSKNSLESWQFLKFLSEKKTLYYYLKDAYRPSPRRDLIKYQLDDPYLGVFARQALSAKSWYQVDNVAIDNIFADMIESVVGGDLTYREAIEKAVSQINLLMKGK